jgi:hypothetical protein
MKIETIEDWQSAAGNCGCCSFLRHTYAPIYLSQYAFGNSNSINLYAFKGVYYRQYKSDYLYDENITSVEQPEEDDEDGEVETTDQNEESEHHYERTLNPKYREYETSTSSTDLWNDPEITVTCRSLSSFTSSEYPEFDYFEESTDSGEEDCPNQNIYPQSDYDETSSGHYKNFEYSFVDGGSDPGEIETTTTITGDHTITHSLPFGLTDALQIGVVWPPSDELEQVSYVDSETTFNPPASESGLPSWSFHHARYKVGVQQYLLDLNWKKYWCEWDVAEFKVIDGGTEELVSIISSHEWEWDGNEENPYSEWFELDAPPVSPGEVSEYRNRRIVNMRYYQWKSSKFGSMPAITGEGVDPP